MCMMADEEYWDFYQSINRRARKPHTCGECHRVIEPGESYNIAGGATEGTWEDHKTCAHCTAAALWLEVVCGGWVFQARQEDFAEHVVGDERYVRSAPLTRLYRWMLADWRDRSGELRPVETVQAVAADAISAYRKQLAKEAA